MSELTIKPRAPRSPADAVSLEAGRPSEKPKVTKLGVKERLNSYVSPEQKRKLRLLAIERGCSLSEVVGILIDEAKTPTV